MPDRSIAVGQGKTCFNPFAIDLIEETQLDRIGGVAPDREVGSTLCNS
jgi:hypothetical protein